MNNVAVLVLAVLGLIFNFAGQAGAEDFTLRGTIADAEGRPVAGAEVALYRSKNVKKPAEFSSNLTSDDGLYTVTLPPGQYWAVAVLRKGEKRFGPLDLGDKHSGEAVELTVGPGAELKHDFTIMDLREAAKQNQKKNSDLVRLAGRVLDQNGQPMAQAYAMADKGQRFKEVPTYLSAWSDNSGTYLLYLPKGHYYVGAATTFPPDPGQALGKEVELTGDRDGFDLALPKK